MGRNSYGDGITVNKSTQIVESVATGGAFIIEDVYPLIDGGQFPVNRIVGEAIGRQWEEYLQAGDTAPVLTAELGEAMAESQWRPDLTRSMLFPLMVDRPLARSGAWYEMVPRSQGTIPGQHGTFKDCIARL